MVNELFDSGNSNRSVWADSAYRSEAAEESLKAQGYRNRIHRKSIRGKPLTDWEKQGNKTRSKTRCRVECLDSSMKRQDGPLHRNGFAFENGRRDFANIDRGDTGQGQRG